MPSGNFPCLEPAVVRLQADRHLDEREEHVKCRSHDHAVAEPRARHCNGLALGSARYCQPRHIE